MGVYRQPHDWNALLTNYISIPVHAARVAMTAKSHLEENPLRSLTSIQSSSGAKLNEGQEHHWSRGRLQPHLIEVCPLALGLATGNDRKSSQGLISFNPAIAGGLAE